MRSAISSEISAGILRPKDSMPFVLPPPLKYFSSKPRKRLAVTRLLDHARFCVSASAQHRAIDLHDVLNCFFTSMRLSYCAATSRAKRSASRSSALLTPMLEPRFAGLINTGYEVLLTVSQTPSLSLKIHRVRKKPNQAQETRNPKKRIS